MAVVLPRLSKRLALLSAGQMSFLVASTWKAFKAYSTLSGTNQEADNIRRVELEADGACFEGEVVLCGRSPPNQVNSVAKRLRSEQAVGLTFQERAKDGCIKVIKIASESSAILWYVPDGSPKMPSALRSVLEDKRVLKTIFNSAEEVKQLRVRFGVELTHFADVSLDSARLGLPERLCNLKFVDELARRCCGVVVGRQPEKRWHRLQATLPELLGQASDAWATLRLHKHTEGLARDRSDGTAPLLRFRTPLQYLLGGHDALETVRERAESLHDASLGREGASKQGTDRSPRSDVRAESIHWTPVVHSSDPTNIGHSNRTSMPWSSLLRWRSSSVTTVTSAGDSNVSLAVATVTSAGSPDDLGKACASQPMPVQGEDKLFTRLHHHLSNVQDQVSDLLRLHKSGTFSQVCRGTVSTFDAAAVHSFHFDAQSAWQLHQLISPRCHGQAVGTTLPSASASLLQELSLAAPQSCHGLPPKYNGLLGNVSVLEQLARFGLGEGQLPTFRFSNASAAVAMVRQMDKLSSTAITSHLHQHQMDLSAMLARAVAALVAESTPCVLLSATAVLPMPYN